MTVITNNTSLNTNNLYNTSTEKLTDQARVSPGKKSENEDASSTNKDKVTFSGDVAVAKTREFMGLDPTGRLKLGDFESVANGREQKIKSMLTSFTEDLDIFKDQKISISLYGQSNIVIEEDFPGKNELEKTLNQDQQFVMAFEQLSANNEILDYTQTLQTRNTSLADYMNSDSDWDDILSIASQYENLKSSDNSLATLLGISKSNMPYKFIHDPTSQSYGVE